MCVTVCLLHCAGYSISFSDLTFIQKGNSGTAVTSVDIIALRYEAISLICVISEPSVQYFKNLVNVNTDLLEQLATKWDNIGLELPEDMEEGRVV